jgi:hypothetical protein
VKIDSVSLSIKDESESRKKFKELATQLSVINENNE